MSGPRHPRRSATPPLIDFSDSESDTTDGGRDNRHSGGRNDAKLPLSSESSSSSSTVDARPIWPSSDAPPQFTVGPRGGFKAIRLSPSLRSILQIIHKRGYPVYYGCSASMVESIKEAIREAQSTRAGMGRRQPTWDSYGPTPCQGRAIRSNSRVPGHHFQSNAHTRERGYVYAAGGRVTISSCRPPKLSSLASVLAEEEEEEEEKRRRGNLPSRKRKHTSSWSDDTAPHKKRRSGSMSSSRPWSDKIDDYLDHRIEAPAPFKGHAFAVIIENVADDVSLETIKVRWKRTASRPYMYFFGRDRNGSDAQYNCHEGRRPHTNTINADTFPSDGP